MIVTSQLSELLLVDHNMIHQQHHHIMMIDLVTFFVAKVKILKKNPNFLNKVLESYAVL